MALRELQVGDEFVIAVDAKLVVKPRGVQRLFSMLFYASSDVIYGALKGKPPIVNYLFLHLVCRLKPMSGNRVFVDVEALAEKYVISTRSVYRALSTLRRADLLRKQTPKGWYAVNPRVAWSGKHGTQYGEALTTWDNGLVGPYMAADSENDAVMSDNA